MIISGVPFGTREAFVVARLHRLEGHVNPDAIALILVADGFAVAGEARPAHEWAIGAVTHTGAGFPHSVLIDRIGLEAAEAPGLADVCGRVPSKGIALVVVMILVVVVVIFVVPALRVEVITARVRLPDTVARVGDRPPLPLEDIFHQSLLEYLLAFLVDVVAVIRPESELQHFLKFALVSARR